MYRNINEEAIIKHYFLAQTSTYFQTTTLCYTQTVYHLVLRIHIAVAEAVLHKVKERRTFFENNMKFFVI
jgi:hypothetical protein